MYAPFSLELVAGSHVAGTSLSAPFVAAGLASVLASFPQTTGKELIRLAKACAVAEPGLNGLGRFSLACMDNSPVFHLNKGTTVSAEETTATVQERHTTLQRMFAITTLPGSSQFTVNVAGASLVRDMEGYFSYSSGIASVPTPVGENIHLTPFHDKERNALGVRVGNEDIFLATAYGTEPSFFGHDGYTVNSLHTTAGTKNLLLRWSHQRGQGSGLVQGVSGDAVGITVTHAMDTPLGLVAPFMSMDRFEGGEATTHAGTMNLHSSKWNHEVGVTTRTTLSESSEFSLLVATSHLGDQDKDAHRAFARYRIRF